MLPGDFEFKRLKPSKKQMILLSIAGFFGLIIFSGVVIALTFVLTAWMNGQPVIFANEGPEQPIVFPHKKHVEELGMDCTFCHRGVDKEAAAHVPTTGLCMTCHSAVGDGLDGITKMRSLYEDDRSIHWIRVHRVPDHVHFVHEAHIRYFSEKEGIEASAVCSKCHGDVANMEEAHGTEDGRVKQVEPLKMGHCVDCHKQHNAPTDCATCHY